MRKEFKTSLKKTAHSVPSGTSNIGTRQNADLKAILHFKKAVNELGLTTESIFRICDKKSTSQITTGAFTKTLRGMNTGLTKATIARLCFMFDEDCSGIIDTEEYQRTLRAYGISDEKRSTEKNKEF